jgi:hypothetical protein
LNISAVFVALDTWDLDRTAKMALLVLCCRADHRSGMVRVPISRVAADLKVSYNTAQYALERVVEAGYVTVDKSPGKTPKWYLAFSTTSSVDEPTSSVDGTNLISLAHELKIRKIRKDSAAAPLGQEPSGAAGENPPRGAYDHLPNWTAQRLARPTNKPGKENPCPKSS